MYNVYAVSNNSLIDIALYEFKHGNVYYRYTNIDGDIAAGGNVYTPLPGISDDGYKQAGASDDRQNLAITLPFGNEVEQKFRGTSPSQSVRVTIRRMAQGDTEAPIYWIGFVAGRAVKDKASVVLNCVTKGVTLKTGGLRNCWTKHCNHMLFGPGCGRGISKTDFAIPATLTSVNGLTFSADEIAGQPAEWFDGGFIEWSAGDGIIERRMILSATGSTATVLTSTDGLESGMDVVLYPGCDLSIETCDGKFGNRANHGGTPNMSEKSPFDGDPIF
jgi:uncharacterized phage protein (TIGR02218 family)